MTSLNQFTTYLLDTADSPDKTSGEYIEFMIVDPSDPFVLSGLMIPGREYTFSCWARASDNYYITINEGDAEAGKYEVGVDGWRFISHTFTATGTDLRITFGSDDAFIIYHPQLEIGNKASDWSPSPEDVAGDINSTRNSISDAEDRLRKDITSATSRIDILEKSISTLVRGNDSTSRMTQTEDGWYFAIGPTEDAVNQVSEDLGKTNKTVDTQGKTLNELSDSVDNIEKTVGWFRLITDPEAILEIGNTEDGTVSPFKLQLTSTKISFMDGTTEAASVSNQALYINKAVVENEFQQGDFVWQARTNRNMGLVWKGGS